MYAMAEPRSQDVYKLEVQDMQQPLSIPIVPPSSLSP
jgi:hypothetical protein